jgi:addiction module RelE/StbE family toxin
VKVRFSRAAKSDLLSIGDYIAQDSPRRALEFVRALREQALRIGETPLAYPLIARFSAQGVRRRVFADYLILYRIEADVVYVVRILHGARDVESLLAPDD